MKKLELGVAYHGNRILKHVQDDMLDILKHNANLVVHMYTHNDMVRNKNLMSDVFKATTDLGLDFWVDNWGLMGAPGDPSHILGYYPDSHSVYSDGEKDPKRICIASDGFMKFTKEWIDCVAEAGGKTIFWDEPSFREKPDGAYTCCCPKCRERFFDTYGKDMPAEVTEEVKEFRVNTIKKYFGEVTEYAHNNGIRSTACLMLHDLNWTRAMLEMPYMENVGIDPYGYKEDVYEYVMGHSKNLLSLSEPAGKESHIWLRCFKNPAGREDDIISAADAAYDAGIRTILAWSFRGGSPCDYHSDNIDMTWHTTGEAFRRLKDREMDARRAESLKKLG